MSSSANPILHWWGRLSRWPGGSRLFSIGLGLVVPYTGTVRPRVIELSAGHSRVRMRDRRRVRNHLRSIHAIALVNIAEVTSGLAMLCALPSGSRGIVTDLSIRYVKKARGTLEATCDCTVEASNEERELDVESTVRDESGDVVAVATVRWKVGPATRRST